MVSLKLVQLILNIIRLFDSYNYALDSTNLSFSIRKLRNEVDYLLSKDSEYQEAMGK